MIDGEQRNCWMLSNDDRVCDYQEIRRLKGPGVVGIVVQGTEIKSDVKPMLQSNSLCCIDSYCVIPEIWKTSMESLAPRGDVHAYWTWFPSQTFSELYRTARIYIGADLSEILGGPTIYDNLYINPNTIKLFWSMFTAKGVASRGVDATPLDFGLLGRIFWWNYSLVCFRGQASRNPMVIVKIFCLYHVTLKHKVIDLVHDYGATQWPSLSRSRSDSTAFIHRFSNSLTQKT